MQTNTSVVSLLMLNDSLHLLFFFFFSFINLIFCPVIFIPFVRTLLPFLSLACVFYVYAR